MEYVSIVDGDSVCRLVVLHRPETVWRSVDRGVRSTDDAMQASGFASQRHNMRSDSVVHMRSIIHVPWEVHGGRMAPSSGGRANYELFTRCTSARRNPIVGLNRVFPVCQIENKV